MSWPGGLTSELQHLTQQTVAHKEEGSRRSDGKHLRTSRVLVLTLQLAGLTLKGYLPGQVICRSVRLGQGKQEGVIPLLGRRHVWSFLQETGSGWTNTSYKWEWLLTSVLKSAPAGKNPVMNGHWQNLSCRFPHGFGPIHIRNELCLQLPDSRKNKTLRGFLSS